MLGRSLESLSVPNYRRWFAGQAASLSGNWVQQVAEAWLVLELTGSGVSVGLIPALQFLPMLLIGAHAGLLADRLNKRRILLATQALMIVPALTLWALTATDAVEVWMVYALVLTRGTMNAIDNPARQAFVFELVGRERVVNAVSLNSILIHSARITGPSIAAVLIATVGVGACFLVNAASFLAMLVALRGMDMSALSPSKPVARASGQIRDALREVRRRPDLHVPLGMMLLIGTLAFNFQALMPLLADFTWNGTATTYAVLVVAMGIGSVAGALMTGTHGRVSPRILVGSATLFGVSDLAAAAAPTVEVQAAVFVLVGATSVTFAAGVNSSLQLAAGDALRGRIMSLFSMVFLGTAAIGSPFIGWLAEAAGARSGLVVGGCAALTAAGLAALAYRHPVDVRQEALT